MNKIKNIIIFLTILIVIAIIALVIISKSESSDNMEHIQEDPGIVERELVNTLQVVDSQTYYYVVKDIVNKYYSYYSILFNIEEYYEGEDQESIAESQIANQSILYNMLDEECIQENGITSDNIITKFPPIKDSSVSITNMYVSEEKSNIGVYVVKGLLKEKKTENINYFQIIVKIDNINRTFVIIPQEYVNEKYGDLQIGAELKTTIPEEINKNKNNTFNYRTVTDEAYAKELFAHFKEQLETTTDLVYDKLDGQYRSKTFQTVDEFKNYIEYNNERFLSMKVTAYDKNTYSGYTQYVFTDKNGNNYIFNETSPFQYTVMLDTYVIPTKDFIDTYNAKKEAEKVVLNIKRFFMGIDDQNYGYSYSVLSQAFKNNKYPTKNDFVNYAKENFFDKNEITYESYEKENGLYVYKIKIKDATGNSTEERGFNIIVRLKDGTDFEMSFGER